jgi:acetamidase/formamidase
MATEHRLGTDRLHHRWNASLSPALTIRSGDTVCFECLESAGGQLTRESTVADFLRIDRGRIHALTGPVRIEDAQPGDVLEVRIRQVRHGGWGWTSLYPGMGLLHERFKDPYLFIWELGETFSDSLAPARVPLRPFCGVMGVAPAGDGESPTRPPGPFGGNMDVRDLTDGATLYLPVFHAGALFSVGDVHAAQGDGEVCLNGIETPAEVVLTFEIRRDFRLDAPMAETPAQPVPANASAGEWLMIEAHTDPMMAAAAATGRMVDFIASRWQLPAEQAYVLCSAAMSLRLSQVVNRPVTTVTASLPKGILSAK